MSAYWVTCTGSQECGDWRGRSLIAILAMLTFLLALPAFGFGATAGSILQSFDLTSSATGTQPFTVGLGFKKGDTFAPTLDIDTYQLEVMKTWEDGSAKHAIASGRVPLATATPQMINVYSGGTQPSGVDLIEEDIATAVPSAMVQCGNIGTVTLSSLLGSPVRTWISGPEMVETHYRSGVGGDPTLTVWFHVRLYADDSVWVRAIVENGVISGTNETETYVPTVIIGGTTIYNNGGTALSHYAHTRWAVEGWIGTTDSEVTVAHDTDYLMESGLVPNYGWTSPSASALNGLAQTYTPMQQGAWTRDMGDTGFQAQIGLLPKWDALYVTSGGDSRAFAAVVANANSLNSYPIVWSDSSTDAPIVLSDWSTWTVDGAGGGGATGVGAGPLRWDVAHHGSGGYLAYLITGDYYHLETMEYQAALCYLVTSSSRGSGTSRVLRPVQTRGVAWANRTVGQLAAIGPSDDIVDDLVALLGTSASYWDTERQKAGQNQLGYLYTYEWYDPGVISPWQQHFWIQTFGMLSDLEPLAGMTALNAVRDNFYKAAVGILGPNGTDYYCFTEASQYTLTVSSASNDPTSWYDSWGTVYEQTHGSPNTFCGNTVGGSSGGAPASAATGYWGNLLPAIAYAVDDNATGASTAWSRLTGAADWSTIDSSGFDDVPNWGIVPRVGGTNPTAPPSPPSGVRLQQP